MSTKEDGQIQVTIDGQLITCPPGLSAIQALWHAGIPKTAGIGCLEGVCGSCRVMVRRKGERTVSMALGCQTVVEDGMQVLFLNFGASGNHAYRLDECSNSWDVQAYFHQVFHEAIHCRHCGGCDKACPKGIEVQRGVGLAVEGSFPEASKLFLECVMCDLCLAACPEKIAPNHVGLFARRVTAYFHIRPSNLIYRLEEMRQGKYTVKYGQSEGKADV